MTDTDTTEDTTADTPEVDEPTDDTPDPAEDSPVADTATADADADDQGDSDEDGDSFPRAYVEKLRAQNARYRDRAKQADTYAARLHAELVKATGRLADPSDLEFDETHLDDPDTLTAAVDDLLASKPHLASRKPVGDIGQGQRGASSESVSLLDILKQRT